MQAAASGRAAPVSGGMVQVRGKIKAENIGFMVDKQAKTILKHNVQHNDFTKKSFIAKS